MALLVGELPVDPPMGVDPVGQNKNKQINKRVTVKIFYWLHSNVEFIHTFYSAVYVIFVCEKVCEIELTFCFVSSFRLD